MSDKTEFDVQRLYDVGFFECGHVKANVPKEPSPRDRFEIYIDAGGGTSHHLTGYFEQYNSVIVGELVKHSEPSPPRPTLVEVVGWISDYTQTPISIHIHPNENSPVRDFKLEENE